MSASADFSNPLRKFKLVFLGEQSGKPRGPGDAGILVRRVLSNGCSSSSASQWGKLL